MSLHMGVIVHIVLWITNLLLLLNKVTQSKDKHFFVCFGLLASIHSFVTDFTWGVFLWCFFLLITSIYLIIFLQIKQQSSTRLVDALSSLSSNQGLTALKPVNQILQVIISSKSLQMGCDYAHILSTLYLHSWTWGLEPDQELEISTIWWLISTTKSTTYKWVE
jgi:hypothetical protein